ncbi:hypothetical protein M501DRAFT_1021008 [Patellaria atrata CBS 101060]|uniref:Uncharacterized protein n=1 Tax=Patellaria atrata CBS 101060 TaxID=1346257 RepID=A0A9P4VIL6_9PEZI|nr:hypothetical protein M501DRAFT_1021008 [Patellaria atrata CBS 101060]
MTPGCGTEAERAFSATTTGYFRGLARVRLSCLRFNDTPVNIYHRQEDVKKVEILRKTFELEGCRRTDEDNFIVALASADLPPLLPIESLLCLNGLHRVRAAEAFLDANDKWWTVKLYAEGLPESIATQFIEQSINEQDYKDGEKWYKIMLYRRNKDEEAENRWRARLTLGKQKDLKQLLKDKLFAAEFDKLLDMPGQWPPIKLGNLHCFLGLKCNEELLNGLKHISAVWERILSRGPKSAVDMVTVSKLELLAPGFSQSDAHRVEELMTSGEIFASITDPGMRREILTNLCSLPCLVPSLRVFFKNLPWLEPCCSILKTLLGGEKKQSIRKGLFAHYFPPPVNYIELAEGLGHLRSSASGAQDQLYALGQLWAFAMRHYPAMTSTLPRKEQGREKPTPKHPNLVLWHRLGDLAVRLGFRTTKTLELQEEDPFRK